eukprot:7304046-Prymnesium_polylepis.1
MQSPSSSPPSLAAPPYGGVTQLAQPAAASKVAGTSARHAPLTKQTVSWRECATPGPCTRTTVPPEREPTAGESVSTASSA